MVRVLALLCLLSSYCLAAPLWLPGAGELESLRGSVASREARLFAQGALRPGASSVDAAGLLLDALAAGAAPERVDALLAALPPLLDRDPASRTYGNIHWYQGDAKLVDRNGIEFVTRKAVLAWLLYRERLMPAQADTLRDFLGWARIGVSRHTVAISYTNIWLMKTWNLIALGAALDAAALAAQGHSMLADWLAYTRRTGINEYLSPSYYDVDLESLALITNLAPDAATRAEARAALDIVWHDIALNWYAPAVRLGGAHSRDYNRLFGVGGVNRWVARAGWESPAAAPQPARSPYEALAWAPPPASAAAWLAGPFPREVSARWGESAEKRYTHYLARNFSIGSAEAGYPSGHDNTPLVISLGAGQDVPAINFFMDGRRDHYGQVRTLEAGSGHLKALHLRPFVSSVQRAGEVLFIASAQESRPEYSALESVLTLPADAEYWLDNRRLDLFTASSRWQPDYAANGSSTFLDVKRREGVEELSLIDRDDKQGVGVSQRFTVQAGQRYRLGASLEGGEVFLYLNYLDAAGRLVGGERNLKVAGGSASFAWREFSAVAPEGAVECKAWLYSTSTNRTELRVRELRFERLDAAGPALLGGFDFREFQPQAIELPAGSTLFVRRGEAVAALRPLAAWDVAGRSVPFTLHNDGLAWRALRLTAVHSPVATNQRASTVMWARAAEGLADDAAFAAFRRQIIAMPASASRDGDVIEARSAGAMPLHLQADPANNQRLLREGQQALPTNPAWAVDGVPLEPGEGS